MTPFVFLYNLDLDFLVSLGSVCYGSYFNSVTGFNYISQKFVWSLKPNEALEYAKKEIEHAPLVTDDPELYAPLFQNVSIFKR